MRAEMNCTSSSPELLGSSFHLPFWAEGITAQKPWVARNGATSVRLVMASALVPFGCSSNSIGADAGAGLGRITS